MPVFSKYNLIFIHIPKNMGTSITNWFGYTDNNNCNYDLKYLFGQHNGRQLQHLKYSELKEFLDNELINRSIFLAVIRCPYDRLISEYRWLKKHSFWSIYLKLHLGSFMDFLVYLECLFDKGLLFKEFVHWHKQVSFIDGLFENENFYLLLFENCVSNLSELAKKFKWNIGEPFPCLNVSVGDFKLNEEDKSFLDYIVKKIYSEDLALYQSLKSST